MKIPTYKRQTAFPTKAGAQQLSVQASPGAFGAPGAAMQQLGQTIQTEGLRWGQWLKQERATERTAMQATNINAFESDIAKAQENAFTNNVEDWRDENWSQIGGVPSSVSTAQQQIQTYGERRKAIETGLYDSLNQRAARISDKTVRDGVLSSGRKRIAAVMPGISSTLRNRYDDYADAQLEIAIDNQIKAAAENGSSILTTQILGDLDGLIEWWGAWGGHKRETIEKRKKKA